MIRRCASLLHHSLTLKVAFDMLIEPGSVYSQRASVRYKFDHAVLGQGASFRGRPIESRQRLSIMLRVRASTMTEAHAAGSSLSAWTNVHLHTVYYTRQCRTLRRKMTCESMASAAAARKETPPQIDKPRKPALPRIAPPIGGPVSVSGGDERSAAHR